MISSYKNKRGEGTKQNKSGFDLERRETNRGTIFQTVILSLVAASKLYPLAVDERANIVGFLTRRYRHSNFLLFFFFFFLPYLFITDQKGISRRRAVRFRRFVCHCHQQAEISSPSITQATLAKRWASCSLRQ